MISVKGKHLYLLQAPIPVNYVTAAVPALAPFGTDYTPEHRIKIVGSRNILIPQSIAHIPRFYSEPLTERP